LRLLPGLGHVRREGYAKTRRRKFGDDAGYGNASKLRAGIAELGKLYVAGIQSQTLVSKPNTRRGRAAKKGRCDASNATSVKELAVGLRAKAWHTIEWREGTNEGLSPRFARVRIHVGANGC